MFVLKHKLLNMNLEVYVYLCLKEGPPHTSQHTISKRGLIIWRKTLKYFLIQQLCVMFNHNWLTWEVWVQKGWSKRVNKKGCLSYSKMIMKLVMSSTLTIILYKKKQNHSLKLPTFNVMLLKSWFFFMSRLANYKKKSLYTLRCWCWTFVLKSTTQHWICLEKNYFHHDFTAQ